MIPPPGGQGGGFPATPAYVYLLRSRATGRYYVGWPTDLAHRLEEHNVGKSNYTRSRGPWELVAYERYHAPEIAKERERALKRSPRMRSLFQKRALNVFRTAKGGPRQVWGDDPTICWVSPFHVFNVFNASEGETVTVTIGASR